VRNIAKTNVLTGLQMTQSTTGLNQDITKNDWVQNNLFEIISGP